MSLFSLFRKVGKKTVDQAIGVTSGSVSVPALDSSRAAFRLVLGMAAAAVVIGGWLMWSAIYGATKPKIVRVNGNANAATPTQELAALRTKDTDTDTLSDYDELYTTHTSPYLVDSDGDSASDSQELTDGTDPNCPKGQGCTSGYASTESQSAAILRRALLSSGISRTVLEQTDDATLLRLYQQTISTTANTNAVAGNANAFVVQPTADSLESLSGAEVRKLLLNNGVDAATLDKLDDATLKKIFQQSVDSLNTNS